MRTPQCPQHPGGRVWRDGRYGKNGQYQRWRCVPSGGTRRDSHLFQPSPLPRKAVGGGCMECERGWSPGDGLPSARTDRFSLREKAEALVQMAQGTTYREASRRARRRSLQRGGEISADGRIAGDWVSMYAPILQAQLLRDYPKYGRWPEVLVLDSAPFHGRARRADGRPKPSGRHLFSVLGALSYGDGTVNDAHALGRRPRIWRYGVSKRVDVPSWTAFFRQLPGQPLYVVCDGHPAIIGAINAHWPGMPVFRCTAHLTMQAQELVRQAGLRETPFGQSINEKTFTSHSRWGWFRLNLETLAEDGYTQSLSPHQRSQLEALRRWTDAIAPEVEFNLENEHAPWSTGGLERPLRVVKNSLYDRRFALRNPDRLNHLLVLFQLAQIGLADAHQWAHVLHDQHLGYQGAPPPRRRVDIPALYPGPRGGRQAAAGA
jgi:hypothetical protein